MASLAEPMVHNVFFAYTKTTVRLIDATSLPSLTGRFHRPGKLQHWGKSQLANILPGLEGEALLHGKAAQHSSMMPPSPVMYSAHPPTTSTMPSGLALPLSCFTMGL